MDLAFGEKSFGRLKWDRKTIKVSLQNFIRTERKHLKRDQLGDHLNKQDVYQNDTLVNEATTEYVE